MSYNVVEVCGSVWKRVSCVSEIHIYSNTTKIIYYYILTSLKSASVRLGRPQTWLLIPSSSYFGECLMPDLHSLSDAVTSSSVLPRQEVMPMPVTTTRGIAESEDGSCGDLDFTGMEEDRNEKELAKCRRVTTMQKP